SNCCGRAHTKAPPPRRLASYNSVMLSRQHFSLWKIATVVVVLSVVCFASKQFVMPKPQAASAYPAHDNHPNEKVTIAADPYDMADKANIFSTHYNEEGFMPVLVVITNDGDQPISLTDMQAQLITVKRTKIPSATVDDLQRRLAHPSASASRSPL